MAVADISALVRLEAELKTSCERAMSSVVLDAKVNLLKYLQVQTVLQFQAAYDDLYHELHKTAGLDCLRSIAPVRSTAVLQPKVLHLQGCSEDEQLEKQLQFYLADAELAKAHLDELVMNVAHDMSKYEVQCVEVKSRESTRRKASRFCDGDVRKVADMARVTVICTTPEALKEAYLAITELPKQQVLRVKNGFKSDWMPSGYRDVKLNPVVNEHLCEIQLHLREFLALKGGQHAVYEWARELNVTTDMRCEDLFENLSDKVTKEMLHLAGENWRGTGYVLPDLQLAAGEYDLAEKSQRQALEDAENEVREVEDHGSKETRCALDRENAARSRLATVLDKQGKHKEAETLYVRSLAVDEKVYGPGHPKVAIGLNNRAEFLRSQGKYEEAEPLYVRSLAIREKAYGPDHPEIATSLNNLALVLESQGEYRKAEPLHVRSMAMCEKLLGPDHPEVAIGLNNWAELLRSQGNYEEAEPLYARSLAIREKVFGSDHPDVVVGLNNWAEFVNSQGEYDKAEPLYVRSLAISERVYGPDHPVVAVCLNNLAALLCRQTGSRYERSQVDMREGARARAPEYGPVDQQPGGDVGCVFSALSISITFQGKYDEAESLYVRTLAILEKIYDPDHPDVATGLNNWAQFLRDQGKYEEAEPLYVRSLAIHEKVYGTDHPAVASGLNNWAEFLRHQVRGMHIRILNLAATSTREKAPGQWHPNMAKSIDNRAGLLNVCGKYEAAVPVYIRSLAIHERVYGPGHPEVATALNNWAGLLRDAGKYDQAEPLYQRAQETMEKSMGRDHPNVATILNNRAGLLKSQGKYEEAEPLYIRSLAIDESVYGPDHPEIAAGLSNQAALFYRQEKYTEALPLLERALSIRAKCFGEKHPHAVETRTNLELVRKEVRA
ncbi:unnamed protein product [Ectocarpus sp. 13 AM-2016]